MQRKSAVTAELPASSEAHLFEKGRQLDKAVEYLKSCGVKRLYPCHCVSLAAKAAMLAELPVVEVGVGLRLELQ